MSYYVTERGADFIISIANKKIVVKVGAGKKDYKQIVKTSKKVKPKYSLIVSNDELEYSEELNAVKIPFKYFLLI